MSFRFSARASKFFRGKRCDTRFFMTWISRLDPLGRRELLSMESLFKSHPRACLLIASNSMDSPKGAKFVKPFLDRGFRVAALSPDYRFLLEGTPAASWLDSLRHGDVDPGEVPLGQNLSNLLRLALVYKFGGVYVDMDVLVLRSLSRLRNAIGAQAVDAGTGNWSRLNNAVLAFDRGHPLLYKFIEEFALTFNGNRWGFNGPYLVSRVVRRVAGRPGFEFSVLPPVAFYPVGWNNIHELFEGPRGRRRPKWVSTKYSAIRNGSYALHLWNSRSKGVEVEEDSVVGRLLSDCCVLCNSSFEQHKMTDRKSVV